MNENTSNFLSNQLYPDLKNWIPNFFNKFLKTPLEKRGIKNFKSLSDLSAQLRSNSINSDIWISVECKPMRFGPFLRNHFLSLINGMNTDMRLGPTIIPSSPNEQTNLIMGMIGQVTTHLKPVGIYPSISEELSQICLYPSDSPACGFIGLMPNINNLIDYLPAITNYKNLIKCGKNCKITGILRFVSPHQLVQSGFSEEKWEELRQTGNIWFLDISVEGACIEVIGEPEVSEMWGGLYASGHIEIIDGSLDLIPLVDGMAESFRKKGFQPHVIQNKGGRGEISVFSKGLRAIIDVQAPLYSIHMDAELALEYKIYKEKFDFICQDFLNVISQVAKDKSVNIANLNDLDFSYTDSSSSYTVLQSLGANLIADPLAITIRDWHRKRSQNTDSSNSVSQILIPSHSNLLPQESKES